MFGTDSVIRDYTVARNDYRNVMPETFNFAFDVIDVRGAKHDKTALIAVGAGWRAHG